VSVSGEPQGEETTRGPNSESQAAPAPPANADREYRIKLADVIIKGVGIFVSIGLIWYEVHSRRQDDARHATESLALERTKATYQQGLERTKVDQEYWKLRAAGCTALSKAAAQVAVEQGQKQESIREVEALAWGPSAIVETHGKPPKPTAAAPATSAPSDRVAIPVSTLAPKEGGSRNDHSMGAAVTAYIHKLSECRSRSTNEECWTELKDCARNIGYECARALCGMLAPASLDPTISVARDDCLAIPPPQRCETSR
jgi:hypothetical protein